jgi:hypothetical protein
MHIFRYQQRLDDSVTKLLPKNQVVQLRYDMSECAETVSPREFIEISCALDLIMQSFLQLKNICNILELISDLLDLV